VVGQRAILSVALGDLLDDPAESLAAAAFAFAAPATAQSVGVAGGFSKGRTHLVATAGTGQAFDESYLVLGLGRATTFSMAST